LNYDAAMHIKIITDDPLFEQAIQLLKIKYRTTAASKATKRAIYEFYEIERENEILSATVESLENEVVRLRQLLDIQRSTKTRAMMRYFK
jgi:cell shape-determining protein MreC